jgi:nitrate reductase beta subunit
LEGDIIEKEQLNVLQHINIMPTEIQIRSVFNEYRIDICRIDAKEVSEMLNLLKKQNYDNRFVIQVGSQ